VEGMKDFANLGAGVSARLGGYGVVTARGAASHFRDVTDTRYAIDLEAGVAGINFFASLERAHAGYQDVVRVTELKARSVRAVPDPFFDAGSEPILLAFSSASERVGINFGVFDTGVALTYARLRLPQHEARLAGASLNRTLFGSVSVWLNAYRDFGDRGDYGVFAGLSVPFGNGMMATGSGGKGKFGSTVSARVSREPDQLENSWGWAVSATAPLSEDLGKQRAALVRYYSRHATLEASVDQIDDKFRVSAFAEGSLVAMGGGLFVSRRIDDSFAVVRGGGPNTPVLSNTLSAARTDSAGRALVPSLGSFRENVVSIDPSELSVDLRPARTQAVVVPGDRAGVIIDFGVELVAGAIVILIDGAGAPLPLGSVATLNGTDETAVVGYDGRTYLTGLAARNSLRVEMEGGTMCTASFDFAPQPGEQVVIGPLPCR
ncbi:MAG TPA: fimbria/pilus outer membrane usher protein, partial [Croceibacterium sp.]